MKTIAFSFITLCFLSCGCSIRINGGTFGERGSGTVVTDVRELPSFSKVEYGGSGSLHVTIGEPGHVEVTCDDNLLEFISTEVENETLRIRTTKGISPTGKYHFEITCPALTKLTLSGSGSASVGEFASDDFGLHLSGSGSASIGNVKSKQIRVSSSGSGSVRVAGVVESASVSTSGSGSINAQELRSQMAEVKSSGSGSIKIHVTNSFRGSSSGSGSIKCFGNPADRSSSSSGSGRVQFAQ